MTNIVMVFNAFVYLLCLGTTSEAWDTADNGGYPLTFGRTSSGHPIEKVK